MTRPENWQVLEALPSHTRVRATVPYVSLTLLSEGDPILYMSTEFGRVQHRLDASIQEILEQNRSGKPTLGDVAE